jgi:hypothetical protein
MYIPFEEMSATSKVWIYQSDRPFSETEKTWIITKLVGFCNQWNSHGNLMPTSFDIKYDQFIILAVDESKMGASGCSIDSSVRILREIENQLSVNLLDSGKISFMDQENITVSNLQDIKNQILSGKLQPESPLFNPSVNKKSDLDEKWLIPAKESWLKKYFSN